MNPDGSDATGKRQRSPAEILNSIPRTDDSPQTRHAKLLVGEYEDLPGRKISKRTCSVYGYQVGTFRGLNAQWANYQNDSGITVGQHIRMPGKEFVSIGNVKAGEVLMFGQHLGSGGKSTRLIITEGQIDALSVYEWLRNHPPFKGPTTCIVSVTNGVGGAEKSLTAHLRWVEQFEDVVIWFDDDEPGRAAAQKAAALIGPKARIVSSWGYKDANEGWVAGDIQTLGEALRRAAKRRPEGIRPAAELVDSILTPSHERGIQFPWPGWNKMTLGMQPGELWMLSAGTNIGKSFIARHICYSFLQQGVKCAYIGLEESNAVTVDRIAGIALSSKFHLFNEAERKALVASDPDWFYQQMQPIRDNLFVLDKFGSEEFEKFVSAVKFYVLGEGCKVVFLDHFSILADGIALNVDQRRAIDKTIKELKELCVSLQFSMLTVAHLSRDGGQKAHEEGGEPSLRDLRGSHSLAQIPDYVVMLQRNPHSEDKIEANTTHCWLKKNRPMGTVGRMNKLCYVHDTQQLQEIPEVKF